MDWKLWIGKKVFIKLVDNSVFSKSLVLDVDDLFIHIRDKFGIEATISFSQIIKIVEDEK